MKSASLILACWPWLFCVAFFGCGDNELAEVNFIRSDPPTGSTRVPTVLARVELFFDGIPQSVTVDGVPAHVEHTIATWEIPDELDSGDIKLAVEWSNKDGSEGEGAIIHYTTAHVSFDTPLLVESTIRDKYVDKYVDLDQVNLSGITFRFTGVVRPGTIEIRPEGGKPLNWSAKWRCDSVTITPPQGGQLLPGKDYVITITGVKFERPDIREDAIEAFYARIPFSTKE
ncbi:MAG: Ig-like domain-containing protein [Candidatus Poribacteria bacterium]|nr:Ig-like domain-containing protein [Candidatus Poribacteria bacterium]